MVTSKGTKTYGITSMDFSEYAMRTQGLVVSQMIDGYGRLTLMLNSSFKLSGGVEVVMPYALKVCGEFSCNGFEYRLPTQVKADVINLLGIKNPELLEHSDLYAKEIIVAKKVYKHLKNSVRKTRNIKLIGDF